MAQIERRVFLTDLGKMSIGFALFGLAACSDDTSPVASSTSAAATSTTSAPSTAAPTTAAPTTEQPATSTSTSTTEAPPTTPAPTGVRWEAVATTGAFVYVVVRDGEAAIIDTGNPGSADAIESILTGLGVGWGAVGHVVLTHLHPDHVGSLAVVLSRAETATGYAGEADIPAIAAPRPLTPVGDGDTVLGMDVIETPGHTLGHISLLEPDSRLLIAGDALNGGSTVAGPNPRFTTDLELANQSVARMATLDFDAAVFGHGVPILEGAKQQVVDLAASL